MLKWAVLGLLLCNGIYFVWQNNLKTSEAPEVKVVSVSVGRGRAVNLIRESAVTRCCVKGLGVW